MNRLFLATLPSPIFCHPICGLGRAFVLCAFEGMYGLSGDQSVNHPGNQEPRRKRTGYGSRFAPKSQIWIASPGTSPQSGGEYVPYSIQFSNHPIDGAIAEWLNSDQENSSGRCRANLTPI